MLKSVGTFKKESGAIVIDEWGRFAALIEGSAGHVDFPEDMIWDLHKKRPGSVFKLAHVHPDMMTDLSARDIQTLETWAFALHPFPARLSVISRIGENSFLEKTYTAFLEPKSIWEARGKGKREITRILEGECEFAGAGPWGADGGYREFLLEKSYGFERYSEAN